MHEDLTGRRFGTLVVIREGPRQGRRITWDCNCDCDHSKVVNRIGNYLRAGRTTSCGCKHFRKRSENHKWKGYGKISGAMFYRIKRDANKRKLKFKISPKDMWEKYIEQKEKCVLTGVDLTMPECYEDERCYNYTASLDRIDSTKGYEFDNIQWVHKIANRMKWDLTQSELVEWSILIVKKCAA